jgi:hypothetical protein
MRKILAVSVTLAVLVGCDAAQQVQPPVTPRNQTAVKSPTPSKSPVAVASPAFVASPAAGMTSDNKFGLPTSVRLPLPASVIATGGGNVISTGGGNYEVLAEEEPFSLAKSLHDNTQVYLGSTTLVEEILKAVGKAKLVPGTEYTFPDEDHPGQELTVLLEVKSDHALVSIGRGKSAKGENQLIGIAYTSPKKGRAVLHTPVPDPEMGRFYLATDYDMEAGTASADGVADTTMIKQPGGKLRAHWEFASTKEAGAGKVFAMKMAAFIHVPDEPQNSGIHAISANFLNDDRAAAIVGVQIGATEGKFLFFPNDGVSWLPQPTPHDFYLDAKGKDVAAASADATLKAILPADEDIYRPFPADPNQGEPFGDSRFAFPQ